MRLTGKTKDKLKRSKTRRDSPILVEGDSLRHPLGAIAAKWRAPSSRLCQMNPTNKA